MTHESHDGVVGFSLRPLSTIVECGSIASLRYPEISFWFIGVFPTEDRGLQATMRGQVHWVQLQQAEAALHPGYLVSPRLEKYQKYSGQTPTFWSQWRPSDEEAGEA